MDLLSQSTSSQPPLQPIHFHSQPTLRMRFTALTFLVSCIALSYACSGMSKELAARSTDDMVLNTRELLEDLGMHARALKGAALSARRLEDLESRMFDIESHI
ncbi:hypothetical protein BKA70DRAFT_1427335 [Coprinopsis sp. MPI-PUGE-AT-0042]|nr:hypothetical protein BKA70DRAFT_1427335 [Coprinopsis sp. MPI-PUGE-AT-0042]